MKKILLIGTVACGKTTLCQKLNGMKLTYKKTQALEIINQTIDTPGEYLEHRSFFSALVTTSVDADVAIFVIDPTQTRYMFSPGQASSFPIPVMGVVSKAELATEEQIACARELLALAGADPILTVSAFTGEGIEALAELLREDTGEPGTESKEPGHTPEIK